MSSAGLSELALQALRREVDEPTLREIAARIRALPAVESEIPAAQVVRSERDAR